MSFIFCVIPDSTTGLRHGEFFWHVVDYSLQNDVKVVSGAAT